MIAWATWNIIGGHMPSQASKERKRIAVAQGQVEGLTSATIARLIGCTPGYVDHLAREPETLAVIEEEWCKRAREHWGLRSANGDEQRRRRFMTCLKC
jgi:hypothetical protein